MAFVLSWKWKICLFDREYCCSFIGSDRQTCVISICAHPFAAQTAGVQEKGR